MNKKKDFFIYLGTLISTILLFRIFLWFYPNANFNAGSYNVHHLYSGAFLLVIAAILLILGIKTKTLIAFAGFGSALVLDELVYLIATDGSDRAYLGPESFYGAIALTSLIIIFVFVLIHYKRSPYG